MRSPGCRGMRSLVHRCIMHVCSAGKEPRPEVRSAVWTLASSIRCRRPVSGSERGPGQHAVVMMAHQFRKVAQLGIQCLGFAIILDRPAIGHTPLVFLPSALVAHALDGFTCKVWNESHAVASRSIEHDMGEPILRPSG